MSHSREEDDVCTSKTPDSLITGSPKAHCRQSDDLCTPIAPRRTPKSPSSAVDDSLVLNTQGSRDNGSLDAHSTQEGDSYAYSTPESINIGSPEAHSTQVNEMKGKQLRKSDCTFLAISNDNSELLVTSGSSVIVEEQENAVIVEREAADNNESSIPTENSAFVRSTHNCECLPPAINHDTPILVKIENVEQDYVETSSQSRIHTSESCLSGVDKSTMVDYSCSQEDISPEQNWNNVMLRLADKKKKLEALKYVADRLSIGFDAPKKSTENVTGQDTILKSCNSGDKVCETIKMFRKENLGNKSDVTNKDTDTLRGTGESKELENMIETNVMQCELSESNKSVEQKQTMQFSVNQEHEKTVHIEENTDSLAICKVVDESGETGDVDYIQQQTVESSSTGYAVSDLSLRESFQESNSCLLPSDNIQDSTDLAEIDRFHCEIIADALQTGAVVECNDADHTNLGDIDTLRKNEEKTNWFSQELNLLTTDMFTKLSYKSQHQKQDGNSLAPTYFDTECGSKRRSKRLYAKVLLARETDCPRNVRYLTETFVSGKDSISTDAYTLQDERETGVDKKKAVNIEPVVKLKETRQNNSGKEINKIILCEPAGQNIKEKWDSKIDADGKNTTTSKTTVEPTLCNQKNKKYNSEQIVGKKSVDEVSGSVDKNTVMSVPCSENKHQSKNRKTEENARACGFDSQKFTLKQPRLLIQRLGGRFERPLKKVVSNKLNVAVAETPAESDELGNLPLIQLKKIIESKHFRVRVEDANFHKANSIYETSSKQVSKKIVGKSSSSEKAGIVRNILPKKLAKREIGKGKNKMGIEIVTDSSTDNSCNYKSSEVTTSKRDSVKIAKQGAMVNGTGDNEIKITELSQSENSDDEERNINYVSSINIKLTKFETGRKLAMEANEETIGNEVSVMRQEFEKISSSKLEANRVSTKTTDKNQSSVEAAVTSQTLRQCIPVHSWEDKYNICFAKRSNENDDNGNARDPMCVENIAKSTEKDQQISGDENVMNLNGEQSDQMSDKVIMPGLLSEQSTQPFDVCEYPETQEFSPKLSETLMEMSMSETEKMINIAESEMNLSGDADKLKSGSLQSYTTSELCDSEDGSIEILPVNKTYTKLTRKDEPLKLTSDLWNIPKLAEPTFKVRPGIQRKRKIELCTIDLVSTKKKQKNSENEPNNEIIVTPDDKIVIPSNKQDDEKKKDDLMLVDSCDSMLDFNVCQTKSSYKTAMTTNRHEIPNKVVHKGENKSPTKKPKMLYLENSARKLVQGRYNIIKASHCDKISKKEVNKDEKGKLESVDKVLLADKAKKHVKTSEPRTIHIDGHCYGNEVFWPNYMEAPYSVTRTISIDKKMKTGIEKTNKRKSSLSSSQNSQNSGISHGLCAERNTSHARSENTNKSLESILCAGIDADNIRNTISESVNRLHGEIGKSKVESLKQGHSKQDEKQKKSMKYASVTNSHRNRGIDSYKGELKIAKNIDGTFKFYRDSRNVKKKKVQLIENTGAVCTDLPGYLKLDSPGTGKQRKEHEHSKLKRDRKLFGNENAGKYRELVNDTTLKKSAGVIPRDLNIRRNTMQMKKCLDKELFPDSEAEAGRLSVDKEMFVQEWLITIKKTRGPGTKDKMRNTESTENSQELSQLGMKWFGFTIIVQFFLLFKLIKRNQSGDISA